MPYMAYMENVPYMEKRAIYGKTFRESCHFLHVITEQN